MYVTMYERGVPKLLLVVGSEWLCSPVGIMVVRVYASLVIISI